MGLCCFVCCVGRGIVGVWYYMFSLVIDWLVGFVGDFVWFSFHLLSGCCWFGVGGVCMCCLWFVFMFCCG